MGVATFLKQHGGNPSGMGAGMPGLGGSGFTGGGAYNFYNQYGPGSPSGGYGGFANYRFNYANQALSGVTAADARAGGYGQALWEARDRFANNNGAFLNLRQGKKDEVQAGKLGVDLSCDASRLRGQTQLTQTAVRRIGARNCLEVGGVWIDEAFDPKMTVVTIKAMSPAYFRLLERQPSARAVLRLGNHLVWVTPSGSALAIDTTTGAETMTDAAIDALFVAKKK
jgi:hypothetical protein